ncbi:MAG: hypothetical protein IPM64_17260 [Phycisphaerales bacterium]|nr:hypothetical protein [Phycisphaerales bacterium]
MTSTSLAEVVRDEINAETWSPALTAVMRLRPVLRIADDGPQPIDDELPLDQLQVIVIPGRRQISRAARGAYRVTIEVAVTIAQIASEADVIDELDGLTDSMDVFLADRRLAALPQMMWQASNMDVPWRPSVFHEQGVYMATLDLTYAAIETP